VADAVNVRIPVVCTNRGEHRAYRFPDVTLDQDGRFVASTDQADPPFTVTTVAGQVYVTWQWRCRRCRRHPQISDTLHPDFWPQIHRARLAGALGQLDISALPF